MREIVFDTESTGLDHKNDRLVSFAAIELEDMVPTGEFLACFVNPGIPSKPAALAIHGLTEDFLADKPSFSAVANILTDFVGGSDLVIHNADFDRRFLRAELDRVMLTPVIKTTCTLGMARELYGWKPQPWGGNKLDHLVDRFKIPDLRAATGKHGALIDALLLVNVYRNLKGLATYDLDLKAYGLGDINETKAGAGSVGAAQEAQNQGAASVAGTR